MRRMGLGKSSTIAFKVSNKERVAIEYAWQQLNYPSLSAMIYDIVLKSMVEKGFWRDGKPVRSLLEDVNIQP